MRDSKNYDKRLEALSEEEFFELIKYGLDLFAALHKLRGEWASK